jgi:hypothetical protein
VAEFRLQSTSVPTLPLECLDEWAGSNAQHAIKIDSSPRSSKRARCTQADIVDSDFDNMPYQEIATQHSTLSRMTMFEGARSCKRPRPSPSTSEGYTSLPFGATAAQFLKDHAFMVLNGPPPDSRHYRRDYQLCNAAKKRAIAHALLMEGDFFGVEAEQPCASCVKRGEKCRIYHPDTQVLPWKAALKDVSKRGVGTACAMCRVNGTAANILGGCCAT